MCTRLSLTAITVARCVSQAHDRLTAMNDPKKGGSAYLQQKVAAARDSLVDVTPPEPEKPQEKEK